MTTPMTQKLQRAQPAPRLQVLLLVADAARCQALRACCEQAQAEVRCASPDDVGRAVFDAAPDRVDVLVLEQRQLRQHGVGMLASWRRMAPHSRLLLLGEDAGPDHDRMAQALREAQFHA